MTFVDRTKGYLARVCVNDATKHGIAAAGAGFILSLIVEAVWPSQRF
jgi:hypothetical protein